MGFTCILLTNIFLVGLIETLIRRYSNAFNLDKSKILSCGKGLDGCKNYEKRRKCHFPLFSLLSCSLFYFLLFVNFLPIKPFANKPLFLRVYSKSLLLVTSNFSFSHSVFYSIGELPAIFIRFKIVGSFGFIIT